ncbi:MAG TPA: hypothetical protein VII06_30635 [Chloroflexota bacterium]|jgi:ABC-type nitrate/sulfonate/bicarbonate transport system substrate-binding protein
MFNAFNRGVNFQLVADWAKLGDPTDRTLSIVVRSDLADSVRSMADLRGRTFAVGGAVIPGAYLSLVVYSPEFAQRPDVATRWMVAYLQGVRDYWAAFHEQKDRDAAIAVLSERLSLKDPRVWETASPEFMDLNGRIDAARLGQQAAFFQREGTLTGDLPDLNRFIDPQFAEGAVRQIGAR